MTDSSRVARLALPIARVLTGAVIAAAIVATFVETAGRATVNPFNFFGYFTIQSNTLFAVTAVISGCVGLIRPGVQPRWLVVLRSLVTVCMIIVGLVYAALLAPLGLEGGVPVPWANWAMHVAGPILAAADWVLATDRGALPWRIALLQLAYPILWIAVVLVRGATDGWVPYPFLDPAQGYPVVAAYVVAIALVFLGVSAAVVWWSRFARARAERASQVRL